jgi:hypothetical protein
MKLKFISDAYYNGEHKYRKGETYEISNQHGEAFRWLKRGLAIEVVEKEIKEIKEIPKVIEEPIVEIEPELEEPQLEEPIVKEVVKKDNVRVKKRKGIALNETSENL